MAEIAKRRGVADMVPESVELLSAILREVLALRAEVAELRQQRSHAATSVEIAFPTLLHAMATASNGLKFNISELLLHAEVVAGSATDQRLHDAIIGAVGAVNGRRLGKLLSRLEGREFDGLHIVRVGADRNGISWRVASLRV